MIGVSQRQAQRYLTAAELPSRRHDEQQAREVDSGTGTLTGGEGTGTHNVNSQSNQPARKPEIADPGKHPPRTSFSRMRQGAPPDYGLVSHDDQGQIRDGPEGLSGDG